MFSVAWLMKLTWACWNVMKKATPTGLIWRNKAADLAEEHRFQCRKWNHQLWEAKTKRQEPGVVTEGWVQEREEWCHMDIKHRKWVGREKKKKEVIVRTDWREGSLVIHSTNLGPLETSWRSRDLQKLSQGRTGAQPALERRCSLWGKPGTGDRSFLPAAVLWRSSWSVKRVAESKGKGKDNEEELGLKAEWGAAISEEDKKEVEKGRQSEKGKPGGSSRARQKESENHTIV